MVAETNRRHDQASLRLWLTYALGAWGALLFPMRDGFFGPMPEYWRGGLVLWIVAAAAAVSIQIWCERPLWSRIGRLPRPSDPVRGALIFIAGPYLLFASRPKGRFRDTPPEDRLAFAAFAVLPHSFLLGVCLHWYTAFRGYPFLRYLIQNFALQGGYMFTLTAWLGCGLLSLFRPWPDRPRFPLIGGLPECPKASPVSVALLMAIFLVPLLAIGSDRIWWVLSGEFLAHRFHKGQSAWGLRFSFILVAWLSFWTVPMVISARWMSDRRGIWGYRVLTLATLAWASCLALTFIPSVYILGWYIASMGLTPKRVFAALYAREWFVAMALFVLWVVFPPRNDRKNEKTPLCWRPHTLKVETEV